MKPEVVSEVVECPSAAKLYWLQNFPQNFFQATLFRWERFLRFNYWRGV
jgi:hypothetical protein